MTFEPQQLILAIVIREEHDALRLMVEIAGWTGSVMILSAYALLTARRLKGNSASYQLLNVIGSVLLIINTVYYGALPPAALNLVWLGIGLYALLRRKFHTRESG